MKLVILVEVNVVFWFLGLFWNFIWLVMMIGILWDLVKCLIKISLIFILIVRWVFGKLRFIFKIMLRIMSRRERVGWVEDYLF